MGETFLISTELVFLDLNPCWRRFADSLSIADSLPVRSKYEVVVVIVGYHYGIFSIRFLWEKTFFPHIFCEAFYIL